MSFKRPMILAVLRYQYIGGTTSLKTTFW